MKTANGSPPTHLSEAMKSFWQQLSKQFELGPEHLLVLRVGCEAFDRSQAARVQIAKEGMVLKNGRRHPLIGVEQKASEVFLKALRDLGLENPDA